MAAAMKIQLHCYCLCGGALESTSYSLEDHTFEFLLGKNLTNSIFFIPLALARRQATRIWKINNKCTMKYHSCSYEDKNFIATVQ